MTDLLCELNTSVYFKIVLHSTGCGRKNSPISEANKLKIKEDTANIFLFSEITQYAVLHQCILNKLSLK